MKKIYIVLATIFALATILTLSSSCYSSTFEPLATAEGTIQETEILYTYEIHTVGGIRDTVTVSRSLHLCTHNGGNYINIDEYGLHYHYVDKFLKLGEVVKMK